MVGALFGILISLTYLVPQVYFPPQVYHPRIVSTCP